MEVKKDGSSEWRYDSWLNQYMNDNEYEIPLITDMISASEIQYSN